VKLTETSLKTLTPKKLNLGPSEPGEPTQRKDIMDGVNIGFGVRVSATGTRTFFVLYGPAEARRRYTLGKWGAVTLEDARAAAIEILSEYKTKDTIKIPRSRRLTFGEHSDRWLETVELTKKDPRHDRRYIKTARKKWGALPLEELTQDQIMDAMKNVVADTRVRHEERIQQLEQRIDSAKEDGFITAELEQQLELMNERENVGNCQANRFLASVRACLSAALTAKNLTSHPAIGIKNFQQNPPRARVLSEKEMKRFADAIAEETDPHIRAAFRLLIETGARRSEVLRAKWRDFDLDAMTWRIPSPKSGHPQVVPLTRQTIALLLHTPQVGKWLVPGANDKNHRVDLAKPWRRIAEKAALDGVHVHDIRRSFGLAVARSAGVHIASKLLRHADVRVTEKVYAPFDLDELRKAAEAVQRPVPDNVVPIEKAKKAGGKK
jgi:integrase